MATLKSNSTGTSQATAACLLGVGVVQIVAALKTNASEENAIGACVCVIAFLHYLWMQSSTPDKKLELRYSDWYVTCPLLLWELHKLAGQQDKSTLVIPVVAVMAMLALGHSAATQIESNSRKKWLLFALGCVAFLVCTMSFISNSKVNKKAVYSFFGVWSLYPLAFILRSNELMDVLDMISKGGFGLYIAAQSFAASKK